MIGYEKKGFYFVLKKTHVFIKRHELKKLIGLDAYDYLIDNCLVYPKPAFTIGYTFFSEDLYIVSKSEENIKKAADYINSLLVLNKMEECL